MPNGLSCAPRIFTKILKPIFSKLRLQGFTSVYYLDDTWLMGSTQNECVENISNTVHTLTSARFIINDAKSVFEPSQEVIFLGFVINSVKMTVSLPVEKQNKIRTLCNEILDLKVFKIRYLAVIIGVLVSCLPGVQFGELYYRFLELNRNQALQLSCGEFEYKTTLSHEANWK